MSDFNVVDKTSLKEAVSIAVNSYSDNYDTTNVKSDIKLTSLGKNVSKGSSNKILVSYKQNSKGEYIDEMKRFSNGDFIDLRCAEETTLKAGEFKLIPLGVAIQLPKGYYAEVVPRSSTFKKYHILMANSIGIIDESYNGDNDIWQFPAYATEDTVIPFNDRICQFTIKKKENFVIEKVEKLNNSNRGGFGSTGTN